MKKFALHWQILAAMIFGVITGLIFLEIGGAKSFVTDWIKPFGTIFIRLLKMIAVPLILVTLINGISNLRDLTKLSRIGGKTIGLYLISTLIAVSLGLALVTVVQPGKKFSEEKRIEYFAKYESKVAAKQSGANSVEDASPLQPVVDMIPDNIFKGFSNNKMMLQVIFFALLFGISLVLIPHNKAAPVKALFEGLNDLMITMVGLIMKYAPIGVFALLCALVVENADDLIELFSALFAYSLTVIAGLVLMAFIIYPLALKLMSGFSYMKFLKGINPAQLVAFSTSSSAATLPVTMQCVENNLGVSKEISSFVLPIGATVNMDGTSLFQAVSALFIAQAYNLDLTIATQLGILVTCTLASIGAAAVPGAGTVMLVIVLEQAGIPVEGLALILAVDRILDMIRTTVNVTGDSAIAVVIAKSEQQLNEV